MESKKLLATHSLSLTTHCSIYTNPMYDYFPETVGPRKVVFFSGRGTISCIEYDGQWELCSTEGDLIDGIERYDSIKDARSRAYTLLNYTLTEGFIGWLKDRLSRVVAQ